MKELGYMTKWSWEFTQIIIGVDRKILPIQEMACLARRRSSASEVITEFRTDIPGARHDLCRCLPAPGVGNEKCGGISARNRRYLKVVKES